MLPLDIIRRCAEKQKFNNQEESTARVGLSHHSTLNTHCSLLTQHRYLNEGALRPSL